jgi:methionine-rich copper-binding protein CopC
VARARRLAVLIAGVLLALAGPAAPAAAHTQLETAEPAADSVLTETPATVRLTFSGPLQAGGDHALGLFGPDGERIGAGAPNLAGDRVLELAVPPLESGGAMTVRYLVLAADGHALEGEYRFTYQAPAPAPSPSPAPSPEPEETASGTAIAAPAPSEEPEQDGGEGLSTPMLVAVGGVAAALGVAAVALMALRNRPGGPNDPARGGDGVSG